MGLLVRPSYGCLAYFLVIFAVECKAYESNYIHYFDRCVFAHSLHAFAGTERQDFAYHGVCYG